MTKEITFLRHLQMRNIFGAYQEQNTPSEENATILK